jgi:cyclase
VIDGVEGYLRFVQQTAEDGAAAGWPPLEAARRADLGPFAGLTDTERLAGNRHRAYAELEGAEPGSPIDLAAALSDMLAFNGGAPLRCLA